MRKQKAPAGAFFVAGGVRWLQVSGVRLQGGGGSK